MFSDSGLFILGDIGSRELLLRRYNEYFFKLDISNIKSKLIGKVFSDSLY